MFHDARIIRNGKLVRKVSGITMAAALLFGCGGSIASAAILCVNPTGAHGCSKTISGALEGGTEGDTVVVYPGTYKEQVEIIRPVSLISLVPQGATIDATGQGNGIFINDLFAAPNIEYGNVVVSGFNIENANFEGILVLNVNNVTLTGNHVHDNDKALNISASMCPGIPQFETNEGDDCGEGIHLMGTTHAQVVGNNVDHNSGGILISDESGPTRDNLITGNKVHDNPFDCGITMASHPPATYLIPDATVPYGVFRNTVARNVSWHNGTQLPGAGAGIGIFAAFPGTRASENVVIDNDVFDNGLPGITMHNHSWSPAPAPPVNLNNNMIVGNHLSGNAADTEDAMTAGPTGINLFSLAPVYGTVISQNTFDRETIDVAIKAPGGLVAAHLNNFNNRATGVSNMGMGTVDATENWWGCILGPGNRGCATKAGSVFSTPWLLTPFLTNIH